MSDKWNPREDIIEFMKVGAQKGVRFNIVSEEYSMNEVLDEVVRGTPFGRQIYERMAEMYDAFDSKVPVDIGSIIRKSGVIDFGC